MENCQNCGGEIAVTFCSTCGQKKYKRIDKNYLVDEFQYSFLHANKGFFYSIKKIIKNPGKTAREFVDGNRVRHYKPLGLTFVLSGISAFITFKIIGTNEIMTSFMNKFKLNTMQSQEQLDQSMAFNVDYNAFLLLALVPFFAISTYLSFKKWGNNYYEHVVMNAYILSFYQLLLILLIYPILYFLQDNEGLFISVFVGTTFLFPLIIMWFFREFYYDKPRKSTYKRSLLTVALTGASYFMLSMMVGITMLVINLLLK